MWVPSLGWEDTPGREHVNPLLYSCLENPMNRGAWQAMYSSQGCKELDMTEQLSMHASWCLSSQKMELCEFLELQKDCYDYYNWPGLQF